MSEDYSWGLSPSAVHNMSREMVLRYRQPWNDKLLPVDIVITLGGATSRWPADDYDVRCECDVLVVTEKSSGVVVRMYNSSLWLSVRYEYQENDSVFSRHTANKLEVVEKEQADANQS